MRFNIEFKEQEELLSLLQLLHISKHGSYELLLRILDFVGASIIYSFFAPTISEYEKLNKIVRGHKGSFLSSSMFRCTLHSEVTAFRVSARYIDLNEFNNS